MTVCVLVEGDCVCFGVGCLCVSWCRMTVCVLVLGDSMCFGVG